MVNTTRCINVSIYFTWSSTLHVSGGLSDHHQEIMTVQKHIEIYYDARPFESQTFIVPLNTTCFDQKLIILRRFNSKIFKKDNNTKNYETPFELGKEYFIFDF